MKRILLMVFRNLWFVPWAWCKLCYRASHTDKYTEEEQYSFIRWVDLHANKGGNVKIDVHGSENIPAENGFMFFPIRACRVLKRRRYGENRRICRILISLIMRESTVRSASIRRRRLILRTLRWCRILTAIPEW